MGRRAGVFVIVLMLQGLAISAHAQGAGTVSPLFSPEDMKPARDHSSSSIQASTSGIPGLKNGNFAENLNKTVENLIVNAPTDSIGFEQLNSLVQKNPGVGNIQVQFPNNTSWTVTPADLLALHSEYVKQAGGLGFGIGGAKIPEMIFSSLQQNAGVAGMIPVNALQGNWQDALAPMLKEMRYDQLSLGDWMPAWLRDWLLASYNFVLSLYYGAVNWVMSFF